MEVTTETIRSERVLAGIKYVVAFMQKLRIMIKL